MVHNDYPLILTIVSKPILRIPINETETSSPMIPQTIIVLASFCFSELPILISRIASPHKNARNDSAMIIPTRDTKKSFAPYTIDENVLPFAVSCPPLNPCAEMTVGKNDTVLKISL